MLITFIWRPTLETMQIYSSRKGRCFPNMPLNSKQLVSAGSSRTFSTSLNPSSFASEKHMHMHSSLFAQGLLVTIDSSEGNFTAQKNAEKLGIDSCPSSAYATLEWFQKSRSGSDFESAQRSSRFQASIQTEQRCNRSLKAENLGRLTHHDQTS